MSAFTLNEMYKRGDDWAWNWFYDAQRIKEFKDLKARKQQKLKMRGPLQYATGDCPTESILKSLDVRKDYKMRAPHEWIFRDSAWLCLHDLPGDLNASQSLRNTTVYLRGIYVEMCQHGNGIMTQIISDLQNLAVNEQLGAGIMRNCRQKTNGLSRGSICHHRN
ncbi:MAG: hypothetical protein ABGZ17_11920 [Planctomycetaceae bacterium]